MYKKNQLYIIVSLAMIIVGIFLFLDDGYKKEMVINEGLLKISDIEYIELVGTENAEIIKIKDKEEIEEIILLLQHLNGPVGLEHLPSSDEALFGLHIALKGHYPSSAIIVYQDKIFHGKGKEVSEEQINELFNTVNGSN